MGSGMLVTLVGIGVAIATLSFVVAIAAKVGKGLDPGKDVWMTEAKPLKD